jgi:lipoprotein-anchoring transpeptidase ErfK/SrfK
MTDYHSVLARAVAQLDSKDEASRRALYARAREAVAARMQAIEPPVSDDQLNAELAALEAAVARIESDIASPIEAVLRAHPHPAPAAPGPAARRPSTGLLRERARRAPPPEPAKAPGSGPTSSAPMPSEVPPRRSLSPGVLLGGLAVVAVIVAAAAYLLWPKSGPSGSGQLQATVPAAIPTPPVTSVTPAASPQPAANSQPPASPSTAISRDVAASKPPPAKDSGPSKDSGANKSVAVASASRPPAELSPTAIPYILRRQVVYFRSTYPVGTIIVIKPQHSLYLVKDNSAAVRYSVGIGADCDNAAGLLVVARKEGGPSAMPQVIAAADRPSASLQSPDGGVAGVPTFYLADSSCRIRATNDVKAIGQNLSSNGLQLFADDMLDLFERVPVGTKVVVTN